MTQSTESEERSVSTHQRSDRMASAVVVSLFIIVPLTLISILLMEQSAPILGIIALITLGMSINFIRKSGQPILVAVTSGTLYGLLLEGHIQIAQVKADLPDIYFLLAIFWSVALFILAVTLDRLSLFGTSS